MKDNTRVMFLRDKNKCPIGCVAMQLSKNRKSIRYQVSTHNPVDKFDRALARQIALGRMLDKPKIYTSYKELNSIHEMLSIVMVNLMNDNSIPNRSQRAAIRWLDIKLKNSFSAPSR